MSYPPTPPPPNQPSSWPPMQAAPIPVQPLGYVPPTYHRPGILTAIAVLSIVVASLGLLLCSLTGLYGVGLAAASASMSRMSATSSATVTPPVTAKPMPSATGQTDQDTPATEDGMTPSERKTVMGALTAMRHLSDARQKHVSALLEKAGRKILPIQGAALTRPVVVANCTDAGQLPSGGKAEGADFFAFARGRIEVDDRHAVFYPTAAGEVVRASAEEGATADDSTTDTDDSTTTATAGTPPITTALTDPQIRQVLTSLESRTGQKLKPAQAQAIRGILTSPGQSFFTPVPPGTAVTNQINSTSINSGTITFSTTTGFASVTATGAVNTMNFMTGPRFPNVLTQAVLTAVCAGLSVALSVYLLIAGIFVIRNSPRGRRLHLIYAWLAIPLSIALGGSLWWLADSFIRGMATFGSTGSRAWAMSFVLAIPVLPALLYAIAVLIVMQTRTVKDYYNSTR